ncbi:MAG TPA: hypothetical protein ENN69_02135 [Spirochaetia bacterium]|nr:hypothetical protein [Spirochaetia bacterium]
MDESIKIETDKRLTLCLLIDNLTGFGGFQKSIWEGVSSFVRDAGCNLLTVPGGSLEYSPYNEFEKYRNVAYRLFRPDLVDGILISGGTMANSISQEKFAAFCRSYSPLPIVSVGPAPENIPQVLVDNDAGIRRAMAHLLRDHGRRRVAFIRGPEGNMDADQRLAVYREELAAAGIKFDPELVFTGDFNMPSGSKAADHWLSQKIRFDAILGSNDNMAIGALQVLEKRKVGVPSEVMVCGFDDIEEAGAQIPSLTTVRQPVFQQGRKAAELVVELIRGGSAPRETTLQAELVIRQSCCGTSGAVEQAAGLITLPISLADVTDEQYHSVLKTKIVREMSERLRGLHHPPPPEKVADLVTAFFKEVFRDKAGLFLPLLEECLRESARKGEEIRVWQEGVSTLQAYFSPDATTRERIRTVAALTHQARIAIGEMDAQCILRDKIRLRSQTQLLLDVARDLISNFNVGDLTDAIIRALGQTEIPGAYLCLYQNPRAPLEGARVIMAYRDGERVTFSDKEASFPTRDLLPSFLVPRDLSFRWILYPLFYRAEELGYILFDQQPQAGEVYESISFQLCSALKGALLVDRVSTAERELEERAAHIKELVLPMLEAIREVSHITSGQTADIGTLENLSRDSSGSVAATLRKAEKMYEMLDRTHELISLIEQVSDKVNVVAINTSIQAAHAGKFGTAFAVIAHEIRKLSDSTRTNAAEITGFVTQINEEMRALFDANQKTGASFGKLEEGIKTLTDSLQAISGRMTHLSGASNEILSVMQDQGERS